MAKKTRACKKVTPTADLEHQLMVEELRREFETRLYKEKLDELIEAHNREADAANALIKDLEHHVETLQYENTQLQLHMQGFWPGDPTEPLLDVASLVEFHPLTLRDFDTE